MIRIFARRGRLRRVDTEPWIATCRKRQRRRSIDTLGGMLAGQECCNPCARPVAADKSPKRFLEAERGVSAVEFALIAPFLFVLTLGLIEFSLLLFDKAVVTNASREGARAAIVYDTNGTDYTPLGVTAIKQIVKDYAAGYLIDLGNSGGPGLTDADITVTYDGPNTPGTPESGGDVTVRVNYTYDFLVFPNMVHLLGGTYDTNVNLVGTTRMRME